MKLCKYRAEIYDLTASEKQDKINYQHTQLTQITLNTTHYKTTKKSKTDTN